jgi:hypothetical protein
MTKNDGSPVNHTVDDGVEICRCPACSSPFSTGRHRSRREPVAPIEAPIVRAPAVRDLLAEARAC